MRTRTKHDIFNDFQTELRINNPPAYMGIDKPFKQYFLDLHRPLLDNYRLFGFHVFLLPPKSKRPFRDSAWAKNCSEHLKGQDQILAGISKGCNLALHLGHSNVIVIDFDNPRQDFEKTTVEYFQNRTLTIKTPHGFHLLTTGDYELDLDKELQAFFNDRGFDMIRREEMYILLPLSETCTRHQDKYGDCDHKERHDYRIREFAGSRFRLREFTTVGLELLKLWDWNPR